MTTRAPWTPQRHAVDVDLGDPRCFLDQLDLESAQARFVWTDRLALSRQAFLDPRWDRGDLPRGEILGTTLDAPVGATVPLHFLWHTSYCCSTLLATLLDRPGACLALKEPRAVVDLADLKRRQQGLERAGLARAVFGLFARRFDPGEQILIKPSNYANNLIPEAAEMTHGRMLMLYSSCQRFLVSVLKGGEDRRAYVRRLFISLASDGHPQAKWSLTTLLGLSDLHVAALVWHMQMAALHTAMARLGERAVSLDGDVFLRRPLDALRALDGFFGLNLGSEELTRRASAPSLDRNVKTGAAGAGLEGRRAEAEGVERAQRVRLDRVVDWAARASPNVAPELPRALI